MRQAARREQIAHDMEIHYRDKVAKEAGRMTETTRVALEEAYRRRVMKAENRYREKRDAVYAITTGSLLYSFLATFLTACNSTRFKKDAAASASFIWDMLTGSVQVVLKACKTVWRVKEFIPYQVIGSTVAVILVSMVFALIIGLIYGATGWLLYEAVRFYRKEFLDLVSGVVALVSMGLLVWFGDQLLWISWNLILVWLLIHGSYILLRMLISGSSG